MNVGIKSAGNLSSFILAPTTSVTTAAPTIGPLTRRMAGTFPGTSTNDFGSYKSYHVLGRLAEFFGGYWHDEDFGMAHCAAYGDKLGRKIWIWGLSREA